MLAGEPVDVVDKFVYPAVQALVDWLEMRLFNKSERPWQLLTTSDTYGAEVTSACLSRGRFTLRCCDLYCFMDQRHGPYAQRIYGRYQCLVIGVSEALVGSGGNNGLVMLRYAR
ncbi:LOW QUALITY PROTEIN: hypothetical protein T265_15385 [Opisthorchis viverrini]|uniref:Uncharacterized protein n=1 Tax=Opisthorchis viverrini TaxID=6198 RepID=A0A074ZA68_OPIVI|nr:LOW QUALITY PROTEIN: hypothetical protein T265_15385 [Opisthorchis viverrini]KER20130.1 LOW QUALITY PROTEIN: hypothetical protein T265_15385 [Opisthorchis viverrini]